MYIYVSYVVHPVHAYTQPHMNIMHMIQLETCVHAFSEHVYTSRRALKLLQPRQEKQLGYCAHEKKRESPMCGRNSQAKAGKINQVEIYVLGAVPRLPMHKFVWISYCALCIYTLQTCSIYVRNYHAAYKYTIQLTHTHSTMHRICLVQSWSWLIESFLYPLFLHAHIIIVLL